ncbi:MAG TPA: ATP-binding protein [Candidatus Competibacteraceae bacterium]|nr:HAMP domain-containing histidine kinase [Candidatus Competibacteraceae bacterium]MCP5132116.1 HAMP domain-containing histidine kinase [Gammaproteobacteria bacterium]HPF58959.1 ATP-binding protein [Candidatus Competibacteraceae bacterium]HRY16777.1 ATP-binding protein [Candidatus Competibacteraceae bacterium]
MEDLRQLLLLRILVVLGPGIMLLWLRFGLTPPAPLPGWPVALFLGWALLAFAALRRCARREKPLTTWELFAYLQLDVLALALLLFFSGGASNPFVSLLLLPLIIAAALLPAGQVWVTAAITVAIYTGLMFHYLPLPSTLSGHGRGFEAHLWGMWLVFVISALLIAGFVARLAAALRNRDRQVAQLRERALRDEQILTLGMFAAGAAHELGTPLSTITVLAKELELLYSENVLLSEDLRTLRQQVEVCKSILGDLLHSADLASDREAAQTLDVLLERTRSRWQLLRPQVPLRVSCAGPPPPPAVTAPQTISQTLISLLNNAADAYPAGVDLTGRWNRQRVTIEIRDQGPGLSEEAANRAGEAFFSTKHGGAGIGLLLANATLERMGGQVSLLRHPQGGTCTRIDLPARIGIA